MSAPIVLHEVVYGYPERTVCGMVVEGGIQTTANSLTEEPWRYCRLCQS